MNNAMNSNINDFANGVGNAFMGSGGHSNDTTWRDQQKKADQDAWNRWHAQDMQKKAEWIAGDAALRGKDKAAWQRVAPCTLTLDNEKTSRKESSQ